MNDLTVIEGIRRRYRPTLATPTLPANMGFEGENAFRGSIELEWYEQTPHSLALVVKAPRQLPEVWEVGRELFGYAISEPFKEFGLGDIRVAAWQPSPIFVSLRNESEKWFTIRIGKASTIARFVHAAHELVPDDRPLTDLPYSPVRTRP
jgi:hypothetical protein